MLYLLQLIAIVLWHVYVKGQDTYLDADDGYWRSIKLIVNWRSSSDEQAATWRSSEGPYESCCEGEPERVCSEKIASCIAILLRQRSWQVKLTIGRISSPNSS